MQKGFYINLDKCENIVLWKIIRWFKIHFSNDKDIYVENTCDEFELNWWNVHEERQYL